MIVDSINNRLKAKIKEVQREVAKEAWAEVIANAPLKSGDYITSIQVSDTTEQDGVIRTAVYSDKLVGGEIPKWQNVPLSAFLEWGTGPLGQGSNTYQHGYPYTTDAPWNAYAEYQFLTTGTWGMVARPHFYPALQKYAPVFVNKMKEELK